MSDTAKVLGLDQWSIPEVLLPSSNSTIVPMPKMNEKKVDKVQTNLLPNHINHRTNINVAINMDDHFDDELQQAINLSLQEFQGGNVLPEQPLDYTRFDGPALHTPFSVMTFHGHTISPPTRTTPIRAPITPIRAPIRAPITPIRAPVIPGRITTIKTVVSTPVKSTPVNSTPVKSTVPVLSENTKLILQQNAEYEASLAADREKAMAEEQRKIQEFYNNSVTNIVSSLDDDEDDTFDMIDDDNDDFPEDDADESFGQTDDITYDLGSEMVVKLRLPDKVEVISLFENELMTVVIARIRKMLPEDSRTKQIILREPPISPITWEPSDTVKTAGITDSMVIMVCVN